MVIVNSYPLAVILCFVIMLCWGSWGNTQKAAAKSWRYELFYWDYVLGMVVFSLLLALTLGSFGPEGRSFFQDIAQADIANIGWIVLGGFIFNASNILLSASTSIAGMSVAFPLGCGLALVLGVFNNLRVEMAQGALKSNVPLLALGVALVVIAVILNGVASGKKGGANQISKQDQRKGVILALVAGIVMSFFSSFVMRAMDLKDFANMEAGKVGPYTAIVVFSLAVLVSHFIFGPLVMKKPFLGEPGYARRYAMVPRYRPQLHCRRQGRRIRFLRSRTGRAYGRRHLGYLYLEGVQGIKQEGLWPSRCDVPLLHHRSRPHCGIR